MAVVAHLLHTPFSELYDLTVDELYAWAETAISTVQRLYADGKP